MGKQKQTWAAAFLALGLLAGCLGGGRKSGSGDPMVEPETPDVVETARLALDEAGLTAQVVDGQLEVTVPLRAKRAGKGTLDISLITVDAETRVDGRRVAFELDADEQREVTARINLPSDLEAQAERAKYTVRVAEPVDEGLRVRKSLLYALPPSELRMEGPARLRDGKKASYRLRAESPITGAAVIGAPVKLLLKKDDSTVETLSGKTDDTGVAVFEITAPAEGSYQVSAFMTDQGSPLSLVETVAVEAKTQKLLITTDKPIYQPGQTMHLRALSLQSPSNTPNEGQDVTFEVEDGKANKVFKKTVSTDKYGIAFTTFKIATLVNEGTYAIKVSGADVSGQKTVSVSRYALPKFGLTMKTERPWYGPGETVAGTLDARYFFGKATGKAQVTLEALTLDAGETVFSQTMGMTDDNGRLPFAIELPRVLAGIPLQNGNALVTLRATVTDTAGQQVQKELAVTVAPQPMLVTLVPEGTAVVPGIENRFHIFVSDPLGAPVADADVSLKSGDESGSGKTNAFGHLELSLTPTESTAQVSVMRGGETVSSDFDFERQAGTSHVLVRSDKSTYDVGESAKVQVLTSDDEQHVYVDIINQGQAVDMRTLAVKDGQASFTLSLDATLLGENRIEAYVVDDQGNIARTGRTILVTRGEALQVALSKDKATYAPGEAAKLTLSVTDAEGKPVAAALGVQIVDEAVFGLIDARPGLLRTFFEIEDAFAMPSYEIHGPAVNVEQLLFEDVVSNDETEAAAAQTKLEATLAALKGNHMLGIFSATWEQTVKDAETLLDPYFEAEVERLGELLVPVVRNVGQELSDKGCDLSGYYCDAISMSVGEYVVSRCREQLEAYDFWGNRYEGVESSGQIVVKSRGADELAGTADDRNVTVPLDGLPKDAWGGLWADAGIMAPGSGGSAAWGGFLDEGVQNDGAGPPTAEPGSPTDTDGDSVRVRSEFPETLYVNPALITDGSGQATIELPMADSITEWRMTAMANSLSGALGGGQAGITVFQDFFVDVNFPAELTRGDEVSFPIVLYNYLSEMQTVAVELEAASWYTPLGSTTASVDLAPGEVRAVSVPVRVEEVGLQTLTVRALGKVLSDAVARTVRVVPDGLAVPLAQSGAVAPGSVTEQVSFPAGAVPGSQQLYADIFPTFLSQAVQGLDSILSEPNGCFEQTTSTTWPNVLVSRYLTATDQSAPEVALKAESLIAAGYQRLLTFEHSGGGFSWFGEQDPAPYLSVTAFGVMEFADMAKVRDVDADMRDRTRAWLLSQQESDGSWPGDMSEFFSFQTSLARNTAFVVWALAQDGYSGSELSQGLDYVGSHLSGSDDAYTLALAANAYAEAAPTDPKLSEILGQLDSMKTVSDGQASWDSAGTQTNFYGAGNDASVATTALVAHAMITAGGYADTVKAALDFITASKDPNGNFGSTQATVWALKTLLLAAEKGTEAAVGQLDVYLDDALFASVDLSAERSDVVTRVDMSALATTGNHGVRFDFVGTGKVSYNLVSRHNVPWASAPAPVQGPLSVAVTYDRTSLQVDETVQATVTVTNNTGSTQNMILVTAGLPPGFELLTEDLDVYVQAGQLSRYERTGKQLILYLTELAGDGDAVYSYRLRAAMPVKAADGGAEVHPYYEPDQSSETAAQELLVN